MGKTNMGQNETHKGQNKTCQGWTETCQQSVIKNLECHNNYDDIDNDNNDCKVCSSNNLELCNYKVEISHNVDVFDLVLYITPEKNSSFYHHQTKSYDFEVTSEKKNILTSTIFLIIHPQIFVTCWRCYIELAIIHFAQMMSYQTFCQNDKVPNIHFAFFLKDILLLPNFRKKSDILPKLHFAHTTFCKNYILPNF